MKKSINIAITNFKGGTGKTTTAVNLAHGLADKGYKVLAIDLDAQANLTDLMGVQIEPEQCISEALRKKNISVTIINIKENLDVIPSHNFSMVGIETELQNMLSKSDRQLERCISPYYDSYDFIIMDLAPALNSLTVNAYNIADRLVVPILSDYLSLTGLYTLENRLENDLEMSISDVLITKHEASTSLAKEVHKELSENRKEILCNTIIPKNIALSEQGIAKESIYDYAPSSAGAVAYREFVNEIIKRTNG